MWKKHHIAILVIAGIGVLYLIYEWAKNHAGSSAGSGATDTSQLPTVITTGGGGYTPSVPSFLPQDFSGASQVTQPLSPTASAAGATQSTPGITVMPGTSGSGVPAYSASAQEFNTNSPIANPSPSNTAPSYYATAAAAPVYNDLSNQQYVPEKGFGPGAKVATLDSYLALSLRSGEVSAANAIGNNRALDQTPEQFQAMITESAGSFCAMHPEACGGDTNSLISDLVSQYKTFINATVTQDQPWLTSNAQFTGQQNLYPVAPAPTAPTSTTPTTAPTSTPDQTPLPPPRRNPLSTVLTTQNPPPRMR